MSATLVTNARLVLEDEILLGTLGFDAAGITSIDTGRTSVPGALDLDGDLLAPGLIELHTDNLERHLMPRPKVSWAEVPALLAHDAEVACAGITTVLDALGVGETDSDSVRASAWDTVLGSLQHCAEHDALRAEHFLHVRCELPAPNTVELFEPFHRHPRLRLVSLMDHTPGQRQWENAEHARIYYTGKKGWSAAKFEARVVGAMEMQRRYADPHRQHFVDYCRRHHIALASHDDTTAEHVHEAHRDGAVICEFPTTRRAAQAARDLDLATVLGAPNVVRGGSHSGNVAAAELARDGLLDILSSDYVPGSLVSAVFGLHRQLNLPLTQCFAMVTRQPADALGLNDRGRLAVGLRADLVRIRPLHRGEGSVQPLVRSVWRQGRQVA
ncbi:MAG: alpha-D-ribose 1-methylphosphonate 5-triphosphate diphosphatase [Steroidobacteraceae bacterium]